VTADSWDRLVTLAAERPLVKMEITSRDPASAKELVALVQPLGAEAVSLTVSTGGPLKDGGTMNYAASDVKPSHPARPLEVARGVFSSLAEESEYEAKFALDFGQAGRAEMREALERLREEAPDGVKVSAKFGKPGGTA